MPLLFSVLILKSRLICPTNVLRHQRHIVQSDIFSRCSNAPEDVSYCLRECPLATHIWNFFLFDTNARGGSDDTLVWLMDNLHKNNIQDSRKLRFACILWQIWRARNSEVLEGVRWTFMQIVHYIKGKGMEQTCIAAFWVWYRYPIQGY